MSDPAGTKNDGGLVFGSQVLTINLVTYIAESFSLTDGSNRIASMNEFGVPNKQAFMDETPTGEATLQLASATTPLPPKYSVVPCITLNAVSVDCIITEVGHAKTQNGETKVTIKLYKKLG